MVEAAAAQASLAPAALAALLEACQEQPTYLDKFAAWQPGKPAGAKRLVVLLPFGVRPELTGQWLDAVGEVATIVWRGCEANEMQENEFSWAECV